jgi:hypothetical protein
VQGIGYDDGTGKRAIVIRSAEKRRQAARRLSGVAARLVYNFFWVETPRPASSKIASKIPSPPLSTAGLSSNTVMSSGNDGWTRHCWAN